MAYIQVEASVRTHRKFLKAGPSASWLWLCGMGYCQDGLTDGFIPFEAIDYLGVKGTTARKLKVTLVAVGLWEEVPGGWRVHDYLQHNKSAETIRQTKERRADGGNKGGRPLKAEPSAETLEVSGKVSGEGNHTQNPSHLISSHLISSTSRPITRRRRLDAAYEHESGLYVPGRAHQDLLALHPPGFEAELVAWYDGVCVSWQGRNTGADMIRFWKARHDETWPPERPAVTPAGPRTIAAKDHPYSRATGTEGRQ